MEFSRPPAAQIEIVALPADISSIRELDRMGWVRRDIRCIAKGTEKELDILSQLFTAGFESDSTAVGSDNASVGRKKTFKESFGEHRAGPQHGFRQPPLRQMPLRYFQLGRERRDAIAKWKINVAASVRRASLVLKQVSNVAIA